MKIGKFIDAMNEIDEDLINESIDYVEKNKKERKIKIHKLIKQLVPVVASFAIVLVSVFTISKVVDHSINNQIEIEETGGNKSNNYETSQSDNKSTMSDKESFQEPVESGKDNTQSSHEVVESGKNYTPSVESAYFPEEKGNNYVTSIEMSNMILSYSNSYSKDEKIEFNAICNNITDDSTLSIKIINENDNPSSETEPAPPSAHSVDENDVVVKEMTIDNPSFSNDIKITPFPVDTGDDYKILITYMGDSITLSYKSAGEIIELERID